MQRDREAAFRAWAVARRDGLRRSAHLLTADWHAADDLVQETLLKVFLRWGRLDPGGMDAYARRVLVSTVLDGRRRPWRRETVHDSLPDRPGPRDETAESDGRRRMLAALRTVPARQRAVLVLRFWEDLSVEQTASELGCSPGTVKSQTAKGLARLRTALGAETPVAENPVAAPVLGGSR